MGAVNSRDAETARNSEEEADGGEADPRRDSSPQERAEPKKDAPNEPSSPESEEGRYTELSTRWGSLELHDLGPAAPVTATRRGALFITHGDEMVFAPRRGPTGFSSIKRPSQDFYKYGRGPAVSESHAYWTSESGKLMRGDLKTRKVEVVSDLARPGTRTSVVTTAGRDLVAFVAQMGQSPMAYLWASPGTSGAEKLQISPDGSTATSVQIVPGAPHPKVVVLEGRTSMSPVHVRTARVTARRITLEPDEVVWIGPGSHVLTEIHAIDSGQGDALAFLPTAKDFDDFGLAQLELDADGGEAPEPGWRIFPNGLDPAPVATAHMCGREYVLFARPSEKRPRSPQELHLAPLGDKVPPSGDLIARSRAFADISLAEDGGSAVAVWTADKRTWAMVLECPD